MNAKVEQVKTGKLDINEKQNVSYCIPLWLRDLQIKEAISRVKGRIEPHYAERTDSIAVVCFGPSLNDTWEQVKNFKYIMSCSGSHKFLVDHGIIPTFHIEVDPREHKVKLIGQPQKETEYLIASTCHPKVFDHLEGYNVKLWHVFDGEQEAMRVLPQGEWSLFGGSSVGLRSLTIARFLGFKDLHVFGMDGNFGKTGKHAAEHPNQPPGHQITEYNGKTYEVTPSTLECAKQTFHELDQMPDVKATFYGEGLCQAMAKNYVPKQLPKGTPTIGYHKVELISPRMKELNAQLHRENLLYGVGGKEHVAAVIKFKESIKAESVGDYGAGKGLLAKGLPFPIYEYDPAIPGKEEQMRPVDLLVSTDMLEHIEPDKIADVLQDMKRCVKKAGYLVINTKPAKKKYADGCLYRNSLIQTEDGLKSISELVNNKYSGKVLAFNKYTKDFVWSQVTGHKAKGNFGSSRKNWVKVVTSGNTASRVLRCTEDHPCATIDDVLHPTLVSYIPAKDLVGKYVVRVPTSHANFKENKLYNKEQISLLVGTLLGDGHITELGICVINHGKVQEDYIRLKSRLLHGRLVELGPSRGGHSKDNSFRLTCPVNQQTKHLRKLFYVNGKKSIGEISKYFDELSLAFWFLDDGFTQLRTKARSPYAVFCTDSFTFKEHLILQDLLKNKFGINSRIVKFHKTYFRLSVGVKDIERLYETIAKFIPESMEYKLPPQFRGGEKYIFNNKCLEYSASEVKDVVYLPHDQWHSSKLYDVEVEKYHNFIANNSVVHNSNTHLLLKDQAWWTKTLSKFFQVGKVENVAGKLHIIVGPKPKEEKKVSTTNTIDEITAVGDAKFYTPNQATKWRADTLLVKEPITIQWINSMQKGEILFDIGANVGGYTILAGKRGVKVYAFEPEAENFALLNRNIRLNEIDARAYCVALAGYEGTGVLNMSQVGVGGSCHTVDKEATAKHIQGSIVMPLSRLTEDLGLPVPNHIKIDVDGLESHVVSGIGKWTLSNKDLKSILIEIDTKKDDYQVIVKTFKDQGFDFDQEQVNRAMRTEGAFKGIAEFLFKRIDTKPVRTESEAVMGQSVAPAPIVSMSTENNLDKIIANKVKSCKVSRYPTPYIFIENIFPEALYQDILENLPDDYVEISKARGVKGYKERLVSLAESFFWKDLDSKLRSGAVKTALCDKFGVSNDYNDETLLIRDLTGYSIGPHTDSPAKVISALFYLPKDSSQIDAGTSLYMPKDKDFKCVGGPHHKFDYFDKITTVPFKPNSLFAFLKTDTSFHGVELYTGSKPRDVLLYDIRRS